MGAEKHLCECGHAREAHIYHEGACRPGFVCEKGCKAFKSAYAFTDKEAEEYRQSCYRLMRQVSELRETGEALRLAAEKEEAGNLGHIWDLAQAITAWKVAVKKSLDPPAGHTEEGE